MTIIALIEYTLFNAKMFYFCFQEIAQLEVLCKQLYETGDSSLRAEAEKTLVQFAAQPDCLNKCQLLLERAHVSAVSFIFSAH